MTDHNDGRHDFDFFHGRWKVKSRRLAERLAGSNDWQEFDAVAECHPLLGGTGNVDTMETIFPDGEPFFGASFRVFNPETRLWAIYWADSRSGVLFPPVYGSFNDGIGTFTGDDTCNGIPVKVVFTWSEITPNSAHWQQKFSSDGGVTWETNWHMHHTRTV